MIGLKETVKGVKFLIFFDYPKSKDVDEKAVLRHCTYSVCGGGNRF